MAKNKQKFKKLFGEDIYNLEKISYKIIAVPDKKNKTINFKTEIVPYVSVDYLTEKNKKYNLFCSERIKDSSLIHNIRQTRIYDYDFPDSVWEMGEKNI